MVFNVYNAGGWSTSPSGGSLGLQFAPNGASNPKIVMQGSSAVTVGGAVNLAGPLTIEGAGAGSLNLAGTVSGTGGITINYQGTAAVRLNAATYTGDTILNSGRFNIWGTGIGSAGNSLIVNGGSISVVTMNNPIVANVNLLNDSTGTFNGIISGPGGLFTEGTPSTSVATTLNATNSYIGPTLVRFTELELASANGSILSTSRIGVVHGLLILGTVVTTNTNRIDDTTPIRLYNSRFELGFADETVGNVSGTGANTIRTQQNRTLTITSFTRGAERSSWSITTGNLASPDGCSLETTSRLISSAAVPDPAP